MTTIGDIKGDTRSLDSSSHVVLVFLARMAISEHCASGRVCVLEFT